MIRPISPRDHGLFEYVSVAVWTLAPGQGGIAGTAARLAWIIAAGILLIALFTDYPLGLVRLIPFRVHGWIDYCLTPLVIAAPWLIGFEHDAHARNLFLVMGCFAWVVSLLTDFSGSARRVLGAH